MTINTLAVGVMRSFCLFIFLGYYYLARSLDSPEAPAGPLATQINKTIGVRGSNLLVFVCLNSRCATVEFQIKIAIPRGFSGVQYQFIQHVNNPWRKGAISRGMFDIAV